MKNLKSTEPIYLDKKYGWCADVYEGEESTCKTDICTVWGSSEEELNYRVTMIKNAYQMLEDLKWIIDKQNNDSMFVSSTESNPEFTEDTLITKMVKIEELIKEMEL